MCVDMHASITYALCEAGDMRCLCIARQLRVGCAMHLHQTDG